VHFVGLRYIIVYNYLYVYIYIYRDVNVFLENFGSATYETACCRDAETRMAWLKDGGAGLLLVCRL
jgi:hypothetical protein